MKTEIILSPYDCGHRGKRMGAGPAGIVEAGLLDRLRGAGHNIVVSEIDVADGFPTEIGTGFVVCRMLADRVDDAIAAGRFPVVLAGNCLTAVGTAAGAGCDSVMWFDQHGDLNRPETSATGFLDGMGFAVLLGRCWQPLAATVSGHRPIAIDHAALVDGRDLDPDEAAFIAETGLAHVAAEEAVEAAGALMGAGARRIYLHVDLDVHDPTLLRANGYAASGGPSPEEVRDAVVGIVRRAPVAAIAVTAYDPTVDPDRRAAAAAIDLIEAALSARAGRC